MIFLGIDPGASGGLAAVLPDGEVRFAWMPKTEHGVWDWVSGLAVDGRAAGRLTRAVIEQVQGFIGGAGNTGSSMFSFGQSYGGLRMALIGAGIPFRTVAPQTWMRRLGISFRRKSEGKTEWKNRLKRHAELLFPQLRVTLATSDALLLAHYCKVIHEEC